MPSINKHSRTRNGMSRQRQPDRGPVSEELRAQVQQRLNEAILKAKSSPTPPTPTNPGYFSCGLYEPGACHEPDGYESSSGSEANSELRLCLHCIEDFMTRNDRCLRIRHEHFVDFPSDLNAYRIWWQHKKELGYDESFAMLRPMHERLPYVTTQNINEMHENIDAEERFWVAFDEATASGQEEKTERFQ